MFFAAYVEKKTEEEMAEVNGKMLKDFLEGMKIAGLQDKALKRVVLTTGVKYYGGDTTIPSSGGYARCFRLTVVKR